jgi:3-methyladenine DNA glycosylase AlkD
LGLSGKTTGKSQLQNCQANPEINICPKQAYTENKKASMLSNNINITASTLQQLLQTKADPLRAQHSLRFFKTAPGQYGHGDQFLGIPIPELRAAIKAYISLPLPQISILLNSPLHEERLAALLILTEQYKKSKKNSTQLTQIFNFYTEHMHCINNWDLVDSSAPGIIGAYLFDKDCSTLITWAQDDNLWKRRVAIVATLFFIRKQQFKLTFTIADLLLQDTEDLIHKATGWMLREAYKKDPHAVEQFLQPRYAKMPRTMLRYSIERLPEERRQAYLLGKI